MKSINGEGLAPFIERDQSVCQIVIASGEPLVIGDMKTDPRLEGHPIVPHLPFRFYAGDPLLTEDGAAIASLCVLKREAQDASQINLRPLTDLSSIAMNELDLWRRNRELERMTETDGLTGITNRRGFDAALDRAIRRARRTQTPLSLLLMDLDYFKKLNDALGHQAGDDVLTHFGLILTGAARRPDDVSARYGGEEFALILPDTDVNGVAEVARTIQAGLVSAALPHPDGNGGLVTASVGIASVARDDLPDPADLVSQADAGLYQAKRLGRNRFLVFSRE
jgi:diguanylate cyclase (GGDEF)-like protein